MFLFSEHVVNAVSDDDSVNLVILVADTQNTVVGVLWWCVVVVMGGLWCVWWLEVGVYVFVPKLFFSY